MVRLIQEAKTMGFPGMMGVTSIRPTDHPLRPKSYFDTDTLWSKYGFEKSPYVLTCQWPTQQPDGTVKEEDNQLACWFNTKDLL